MLHATRRVWLVLAVSVSVQTAYAQGPNYRALALQCDAEDSRFFGATKYLVGTQPAGWWMRKQLLGGRMLQWQGRAMELDTASTDWSDSGYAVARHLTDSLWASDSLATRFALEGLVAEAGYFSRQVAGWASRLLRERYGGATLYALVAASMASPQDGAWDYAIGALKPPLADQLQAGVLVHVCFSVLRLRYIADFAEPRGTEDASRRGDLRRAQLMLTGRFRRTADSLVALVDE